MTTKDSTNRTITLPISEKIYADFMINNDFAHKLIQSAYDKMPELFPVDLSLGYKLNGRTRPSKKMDGFQMRKIKVSGITYQLRPSFMFPYCREKVDFVSKGLLLLKFGVPFWALAFVFGYNEAWWYRIYIFLSTYDVVGTTVYASEDLPKHILADEHHIKAQGNKKYVATTVGGSCFLGMEVCDGASELDLIQGYGIFKTECELVDGDYAPLSVNTDGWLATQKAWQTLYGNIKIIECFLHAYLKIRDRATKKLRAAFKEIGDKVWDIYQADTKRQVAQRIRRLQEWVTKNVQSCAMKENVLKLCNKKNKWLEHIDNPMAERTSNMLDRLMRAMKKHKMNSQMFHSTTEATTKNFRAFALVYNFTPSVPIVWKDKVELKSPAARLNKRVYADNWLENLIISANRHFFRQHSKM